MTTALIKDLIKAGAHFGHQSRKWNPKMKPYIFTKKNGIHIINLTITSKLLVKACDFLTDLISDGGKILFVGTKPQAKGSIREVAERLEMPYVSERWLGGMLTNIKTIRQSVKKLENFLKMEEDGSLSELSKKEQSSIQKKKARLLTNLEGVRFMTSPPDALFIIDPHHEMNAVKEARKLRIPIISIADTNCQPDMIDYLIPANDDAIRTIEYVLNCVAESVEKGREIWTKKEEERLKREAEEKAAEERRKEEQRKKAENLKKAKEEAEASQKAKADAIIADLEKSKE